MVFSLLWHISSFLRFSGLRILRDKNIHHQIKQYIKKQENYITFRMVFLNILHISTFWTYYILFAKKCITYVISIFKYRMSIPFGLFLLISLHMSHFYSRLSGLIALCDKRNYINYFINIFINRIFTYSFE